MIRSQQKTIKDKIKQKGWLNSFRTLMRFVADRAVEIEIGEVASSMALTTLLAIVPVLALSLAVFAAFPSFAEARQSLQDLIVMSFLPEQYSSVLVGYLNEFTSHAAGLTTFGLIGLAVTALLLIDKLFVTVNRIFKVRAMRPWSQRALIYWALLTIGPAALALSLSMTGKLTAMALEGVGSGTASFLYNTGQIVLQSLCFALIYKYVPACRVQFSHALMGGLLVVLAGQIVKQGFEYYITAGTLTNIYGAFVALPALIVWIYVAWFLFFTGAAVTATIPKLTAGRFLDSYRAGNDFLTGLAMLRELVLLRLAGLTPMMTTEQMCDAVDTYPEAAERILSVLASARYIAPAAGSDGVQGWVLVADCRSADLMRAFEAFAVSGQNSLVRGASRNQMIEGSLESWWTAMKSSTALTTPIAEVFANKKQIAALQNLHAEEPPAAAQSSLAEDALKHEEAATETVLLKSPAPSKASSGSA